MLWELHPSAIHSSSMRAMELVKAVRKRDLNALFSVKSSGCSLAVKPPGMNTMWMLGYCSFAAVPNSMLVCMGAPSSNRRMGPGPSGSVNFSMICSIAPVVCAVAHEHIGTGQDNVGQRFGCFTLEHDLQPTSRYMRLACQQTRQLGPRVSNTYGAFSAFAPTVIGGRTQANCSLVCVHPPLQRDCFLSGHPIQLPLQVNAQIVRPVLCESRRPLQPNPLIAPAQACHETPHPPFACGRRDAKGNELIRENLADAVTG